MNYTTWQHKAMLRFLSNALNIRQIRLAWVRLESLMQFVYLSLKRKRVIARHQLLNGGHVDAAVLDRNLDALAGAVVSDRYGLGHGVQLLVRRHFMAASTRHCVEIRRMFVDHQPPRNVALNNLEGHMRSDIGLHSAWLLRAVSCRVSAA